MRRIVICSGKVNRYGYRVVPSGIDLSRYLKNPVLLIHHEGRTLSIGKMKHIRIDKSGEYAGMLTGEPEFDLEDPIGKEVARKYDKGYMNACSIGHDPREVSDDPKHIIPGQRRHSVLTCELLEISMCNIPGDADAVAQLSANSELSIDQVIPLIELNKDPEQGKSDESINNDNHTMKQVIQELNLAANASESEVVEAIKTLKLQNETAATARVDALMKLGKSKGVITDDNEQTYHKLAMSDYDSVESLIGKAEASSTDQKPTETLDLNAVVGALMKNSQGDAADKGDTYLALSMDNPEKLNKIRLEKPDYYEKLAAAYDKPVAE